MAASRRSSVVIHGHFYQPPREDPWLETLEAQALAAPFHDWNARVTEECYQAVVAARVPGPGGRIAEIVNTLEFMSFNFGPTLLEWMEAAFPDTYAEIIRADVRSRSRNDGHGNAIAQAYHHTILPLASHQEKVIEVRWGIADFRRRFGRDPQGMWLPETALDSETLDVLAQEGIAFTVVAPHQVKTPPPGGLPGLYRTSGGRTIALFIYDGPLSHGVAFGPLVQDAEEWGKAMTGTNRSLISIATDGETYGHHHRFGEMALAAVINILRRSRKMRVENFASFLSRNPPRHEVEIVEPSSWSCTHGVERWRSGCGCRMDPALETQQDWRTGLREAMEWLAGEMHRIYRTEGSSFMKDPWKTLEDYASGSETGVTDVRCRELLEMGRLALRFFTSCGWFFDDLAGVEPIQILRYASRALELAGPARGELEDGFLHRLEAALSNESPPRSGREIFLEEATPPVPPHLRVAAGAALWEALSPPPVTTPPTPRTGAAAPDEPEAANVAPGVPGFAVARLEWNLFLVTHRRTGRSWRVETEVHRPSAEAAAVRARLVESDDEFSSFGFHDLPEAFRLAIRDEIDQRLPDFGDALTSAIRALRKDSTRGSKAIQRRIRKIRDLADLHALLEEPIPFDAQTAFQHLLLDVEPVVALELSVLREPLGFTPLA